MSLYGRVKGRLLILIPIGNRLSHEFSLMDCQFRVWNWHAPRWPDPGSLNKVAFERCFLCPECFLHFLLFDFIGFLPQSSEPMKGAIVSFSLDGGQDNTIASTNDHPDVVKTIASKVVSTWIRLLPELMPLSLRKQLCRIDGYSKCERWWNNRNGSETREKWKDIAGMQTDPMSFMFIGSVF